MINKVRTRSILLMIAHFLVIGGNAVAHFILAAILDPEIYGSIFFFITALNFILMGSMLGFQHVIMHQAPRLAAQKNHQTLTELVYGSWNVCTILGLSLTLLFAIWHFFIMPIPMPGANGAILCLLAIAPLSAFLRISLPFILSRGGTFSGVLPDQGLQALGLLLMPLLVYGGIAGTLDNVPFLLSGQIITGILGVILAIFYVRYYFKEIGHYKFDFWKPITTWKSLNLPFFAFSLSQQAVQRLDLLMIGVLAGPTDLAIYAVALKIAQILNLPAMASKAALAPRFSMLFEKSSFPDIRKLLISGTLSLAAIGTITGVGVYFLSPFILELIGEIYLKDSLKILSILIVAELVICVFTPLKIKSLMGTSQKFLSIIFALGVISSFILNLHYIPVYGIEGAAFIRLLVMIGIHILMGLNAKQKIKEN